MTKEELIRLKGAVDVLHEVLPRLIDWFSFVEKSESEGDDAVLKKDLDWEDFSVRAANVLRANDIRTLGDLLSKSRMDYLNMRNAGKVVLIEIEDYADRYGYKLR